MIIKHIHIYGYGKLVDYQLDITDRFHTIIGENEAGKSTIMSFIHSILFGFPLRNQQENRYEPREGMKFGGKITFETDQHVVFTIERVSGKAAGEVTVYFEDGTVGGEDELTQLLNGMNKKLFTSIFSFGLQGLQDIQSINGDELSQYLLSTSILGNDQIIELEKKLTKEMELLFKPSGKKPELNQDLEATARLAQQVHAAKAQAGEYQILITEEYRLDSEIKEVKKELQELRLLTNSLDVFEQYIPLKTELTSIQTQKKQLGEPPNIPIDGLKRMEQINQNLLPLEARIKGLRKQYDDYQKKIDNLTIDEELIHCEAEVKSFVQQYNNVVHIKDKLSELNSKINNMKDRVIQIQNTLGIHLVEEQIEEIPLSLAVKNDLKLLVEDYLSLLHKKEILEQQQDQIKGQIEVIENNLYNYRQQLLSVERKKELLSIVEIQRNHKVLHNNRQQSHSKYERVKKQISEQEKQKKSVERIRSIFILPFSLVMLGYGIWQLVMGQVVTGILFLIIGALLGVSAWVLTKVFHNRPLQLSLQEELKELKEELVKLDQVNHNSSNWMEAEQLIAKDDQFQQLINKEEILLQQLGSEYERTIQQFEKWEHSYYDVSLKLDQVKVKLKVPQAYSYQMILEYYEHLEELVQTSRELKQHNQDQMKLTQIVNDYQTGYQELLQRIGRTFSAIEVTPTNLSDELEVEKGKKREWDLIKENQKEVMEELEQLTSEAEYFEEQILQLYKASGAENEDVFREKASLLEKWNDLDLHEKRINEHMMVLLHYNHNNLQDFNNQWEVLYEQLNQRDTYVNTYEEYLQREKTLVAEFAKIQLQKKQMEEAGTYSTLLQKLELQKSKLQDKVKEWSKLAVAKGVLQRTKDYYRMVRLPEVLQKSEQHFRVLTKDGYSRVLLQDDIHSIIVERKDGVRFMPNELSQATSEQLYLSIRLALAGYYQSTVTFPIIIDDSFVNFDEARYEVTLKLLKELAKERQIIFFTCHQGALPYLSEDEHGITRLQGPLTNKSLVRDKI
ncbi:AAA family ATPase [Bacillus sp. AK128]